MALTPAGKKKMLAYGMCFAFIINLFRFNGKCVLERILMIVTFSHVCVCVCDPAFIIILDVAVLALSVLVNIFQEFFCQSQPARFLARSTLPIIDNQYFNVTGIFATQSWQIYSHSFYLS